MDLQPEWGRRLHLFCEGNQRDGTSRVDEEGHERVGTSSCSSSSRLVPARTQRGYARDVAARPGEAGDKTTDRVARLSRRQSGSSWSPPWPQAPKECQWRQSLSPDGEPDRPQTPVSIILTSPNDIRSLRLALDIAGFLQPLEGTQATSHTSERWPPRNPITASPAAARARERHAAAAPASSDELAPPHSITSSARASSVGGSAERLGGFQVDHQLELGRLLHRQVSRLLAF